MARRAYHHGDLRRTVLDASLALIEEVGVASLSMREVARRAGVTHGAPYHHFADRGAIVAALAAEGFERLEREMRAAMTASTGGRQRFEACGLAYFAFAVGNPAYFRLMFRPELADPSIHPDVDAAAARAFNVLVECVLDLQAAQLVPPGDFRPLVLTAWSTAHGLSSLCVDGPLSRGVLGLGNDLLHVAAMVSSTLGGLLVQSPPEAAKPRRRGDSSRH